MVQQTLLVVLCLEHPMKDKRSGYLLTFSGPSIMEQSETYFYYKNTQTLHVYFVDKILFLCPLSDCWPFLASVFCYYVFIERKKTLSTDFSLIRDNVFIHYTPIILIKIKFMCLVLCIILKIFSKALFHRYIKPWMLQDIYTRLLMTQINLAMKTFEAGTTGEMNTIISRAKRNIHWLRSFLLGIALTNDHDLT